MGLDCFYYTTNKNNVDCAYELSANEYEELHSKGELKDFRYYRKFYSLNDWMTSLYFNKYESANDDFNIGKYLILDMAEITSLKHYLENEVNFFEEITNEEREIISRFIEDAVEEITNGNVIIYTCWW